MDDLTQEKLLAVRGITKSFGHNSVLRGVDLDLDGGDVLALIGGNGAGKSTLMKIIMGIYHPDDGQILINGKPANFTNAAAALEARVYMVPQEPMLFPHMTVEENIAMGFREQAAALRTRMIALMDSIGWKLDLSRKASSLSIAEQTLVEIIRGLLRDARILILDEPTSALTFDEVESFFKVVEDLRQKKIGIIYITHRLSEVFEIASHVSIMRDGKITLCGRVAEFNRDMLVRGLLPTGSQESGSQKRGQLAPSAGMDYSQLKPVLELKNLTGHGFRDMSLKVFPGEILGVAGVVGAGRTELVSTIFGRDKILSGQVILDGQDITGFSTAEILKCGINYVPEDRHNHGLFKIRSVCENTSSAVLAGRKVGRFFLNHKQESELAGKYIQDFRIKVTDQDQLAGSLSGGNQQKVVIGRALSTLPKLIILDEPTRGIDAAARGDVYHIIRQLRDQGVAILLVSSDIEEIIELSDRAITVFHGSMNGEFATGAITQDRLTAASFGLNPDSEGQS